MSRNNRFQVTDYTNQFAKEQRLRRSKDTNYRFMVDHYIVEIAEYAELYENIERYYIEDYDITIIKGPVIKETRPKKGMTINELAFLRKQAGVVIMESVESVRIIYYQDTETFNKEAQELRDSIKA